MNPFKTWAGGVCINTSGDFLWGFVVGTRGLQHTVLKARTHGHPTVDFIYVDVTQKEQERRLRVRRVADPARVKPRLELVSRPLLRRLLISAMQIIGNSTNLY